MRIDRDGWSGVPGLWAGGEAAGGVHGASRLAGNSGSDVLVFGARAGRAAAAAVLATHETGESRERPAHAGAPARASAPSRDWAAIETAAAAPLRSAIGRAGHGSPDEVKRTVRLIMGRAASLHRDHGALTKGLADLETLAGEIDAGLGARDVDEAVAALEARNMVLVARMVVSAALARTESRGAHQRLDFPARDDATWLWHLAIVRSADGAMRLEHLPVADAP